MRTAEAAAVSQGCLPPCPPWVFNHSHLLSHVLEPVLEMSPCPKTISSPKLPRLPVTSAGEFVGVKANDLSDDLWRGSHTCASTLSCCSPVAARPHTHPPPPPTRPPGGRAVVGVVIYGPRQAFPALSAWCFLTRSGSLGRLAAASRSGPACLSVVAAHRDEPSTSRRCGKSIAASHAPL